MSETKIQPGTKANFFTLQSAVNADRALAMIALDKETGDVARLNGAAKRPIENDINNVVEVTQSMFKLSDGETGGILNHLARGGDMTQWGLANAFTAYSQEVTDYDRATDFEVMGGMVIDLSVNDWRRVAAAN